LYTRVKKLPFTAPLVRQQVRIVLHRLSKIDAAQRVKGATLFPLFVSGCEAVDEQVRVRILEELRSLESTFAHPQDRTSALQHVWHIRDSQPGLVWPQWVWQSKLHHIMAAFKVVLTMQLQWTQNIELVYYFKAINRDKSSLGTLQLCSLWFVSYLSISAGRILPTLALFNLDKQMIEHWSLNHQLLGLSPCSTYIHLIAQRAIQSVTPKAPILAANCIFENDSY
jgi:hypothetical protein